MERSAKSFEPDDPMALVGVKLDESPGDEALAEMAAAIIEEYARLGWSGERIMRLFRSPVFRMPHRILELKGEDFVRRLVAEADVIHQQLSALEGQR